MNQVLKTRSITAFFFVLVVFAAIFTGTWGQILLFSAVGVGSSYEYLKMTNSPKPIPMPLFVSGILLLIGSSVGLLGYSDRSEAQLWSFLCVAILTLYSVLMITGRSLHHKTNFRWIMFTYPILPIIVILSAIYLLGDRSTLFILSSFVMIWIADSGAYIVGSNFGKRKLFPRVSPNKTWEGTLGAGLATILCGLGFYAVEGQSNLTFWLGASCIFWALGTIGDLFESSIKRECGVKDSGNFMPGHGGFLDRFDSIIFALPFVWVWAQICGF